MQIHYVGTNIFCSEWSTNLFLFHYLLYFKNINYFRLNISGYLLSKMKSWIKKSYRFLMNQHNYNAAWLSW